jgi:hypothetical protein
LPVLSNLDERLLKAPFDADNFQRRLPAAQAAAERIHLVHVAGMLNDEEKWRVFISMITDPPHEIPTSDNATYCSNATRQAEDLLGFPRSVYFYAGRAHPSFGNLALVFGSNCQRGHSGSVTPFDTGGFVWQPTPPINVRLAPNDEMLHRVRYCKNSELKLDEWRDAFARTLAAYFDELRDYWTGRPARSDPEGLYELNADWRCWTFEIRFAEPQLVHDRVAWCADEGVMHRLFRMLNDEPNIPGVPRPVHKFLSDPPALEAKGTPFYCKTIEAWVQEQLGL